VARVPEGNLSAARATRRNSVATIRWSRTPAVAGGEPHDRRPMIAGSNSREQISGGTS
jgi:hypothetical protein